MMTNEKIRDYNMCIRIHIGVRDNDVLQVIGNFDEWSSDVVGMNATWNYYVNEMFVFGVTLVIGVMMKVIGIIDL